jgi:hypothetical protein
MSEDLVDTWKDRNAAALSLARDEERMRRAVREADGAALVALIETFSPARSNGPEWTRTFEPLVERLWAWRDDVTMAALADVFRARGMPWMAVTNALSPENGARIRGSLGHPAWARLPAFAVA